MIRLLLLFLLPFSLYASKILSYNIYERTDRADVMITFDTPYTGTIKQSKGKSKTILKLEDASIESSKIKKVNSEYLKSLTITPLIDYTQIVAVTPSSVKLLASKTSDGYGLRLRFTSQAAVQQTTTTTSSSPSLGALPTKKGDDLSSSYYLVVAILVIGIIILFYLKSKMQPKQPQQRKQNSWLFEQNDSKQQNNQPQEKQPQNNNITNEISLRFQKNLDQQNSVVMLDFLNQSYLVLIGNGNILLDKFVDNKPTTQQEFETILQERYSELEEFLHNPQQPSKNIHSPLDEPLQSYKERAASLAYGE
jgi:hypothetical protein